METPTEAIKSLIEDMKRVAPGFNNTLTKLESEIERLTNEIMALKMAGPDPAIRECKWFGYGMTDLETKLLMVLERAGEAGVGSDRLMASCYGDMTKDWPDPNVLKVRVCNIRKKLTAHNAPYYIETIHGKGWVLREGTGISIKNEQGHVIWRRPDQLKVAKEALARIAA